MAKVRSRRLVIDACVARAAGGIDAVHPTSKHCRDVLIAVKAVGPRVVLTTSIASEWNKSRPDTSGSRYASAFARKWLVDMHGRKLIEQIEVNQDPSLRSRVAKAAESPKIAAILDKDLHLIEAALATDKIVISIETNCREEFRAIAPAVAELPQIGWVNPADPTEKAVEWLESGAKIADCRRLAPIISPRLSRELRCLEIQGATTHPDLL